MSWSTSELRVRLAPLNRFKPSSKIFYWPFQGGTSFVDLLCFCSVLCLLCFVRVCLYVLCGHLLGKGWPLGSRLWCLLWVCHFPIGILGQVWYLIVSIPDLLCLYLVHDSYISKFEFMNYLFSNLLVAWLYLSQTQLAKALILCWWHNKRFYELRRRVIPFIPFIPNVFSHLYQLNGFISIFKVVGWYFSFLFTF